MTERNVTYLASIKPVDAEGKHQAKVYVIDPTLNRAGWKAKREAIERAKTSLMKQPLLYEPGPNEKSDWVEADDPFWGGSHKGEWIQAGQPVQVEEGSDGSFHVIYDINTDHAWEDIVSKRARAASPSCEIYDAHLTRSREGGAPELELNDLEFNHVLLLPPGHEGAYPNAGVESFWETQAAWSGFTGAVSGALGDDENMTEEDGELAESEEDEIESFLEDAGLEITEQGTILRDEELLKLIREAPVVDLTGEAAKKWAQKAVKRPGRVRNYLESRGLIKKGATIPISLLRRLFKSTKDRSLKAAFLLAIRFKTGLKKKGVVGGQAAEAVSIEKKAQRLKQLRAKRDQLEGKVNKFDSSQEAAKKQEIYTELKAVNREIDDLRFDIENSLEALNGEQPTNNQITTMGGELLGAEQPPVDRTKMSEKPDLTKQLEDANTALKGKDKEITDLNAKNLELSKQVQEAGLSLKAHEEGLGVAHLQAQYRDAQAEMTRLLKELTNTKASASMIENLYRKVMVNKIVSARVEAGVLSSNEVDAYVAEAMKLPFDKLDEHLTESEKFAEAMRKQGLGRRETYGAGAALQSSSKPNGYTTGDLSGVYK